MSKTRADLARHHAAGGTNRGGRGVWTVEEMAEDQGVGRQAKGRHGVNLVPGRTRRIAVMVGR